MLTYRDNGKLFEELINSYLRRTNLYVLSVKDIKKKYGIDTTSIDHLIETISINICIKYDNSNPCISKINHFIQCVTNVSTRSKKKCIGIYLSKIQLSKNSLEALLKNNYSNKFFSINHCNEKFIIYELINLLYSYEIFLYEEDGSCIMLH
jgi:hypothetical protein